MKNSKRAASAESSQTPSKRTGNDRLIEPLRGVAAETGAGARGDPGSGRHICRVYAHIGNFDQLFELYQ